MDMNIVDNHGKSPTSKVVNGNAVDAHKNHRKVKRSFRSYDPNHKNSCVVQ
jgi:hypothetical protein